MVRRLHNWTYRDATDFLREHGFAFFKEVRGSHQAWIKRAATEMTDRIVGINFTHSSFPTKAVKRMIRQSGIDADKWIGWSTS